MIEEARCRYCGHYTDNACGICSACRDDDWVRQADDNWKKIYED